MLRRSKYPFVPTPFYEVGKQFIATGIVPAQTKGEKYDEHSTVSQQRERRQLNNSDNGFTRTDIR